MRRVLKRIVIGAIIMAMLVPSVAFGAALNYGSNILWDNQWYYSYSQPSDQVAIIYSAGFQGELVDKDNGGSMANAMTQIKELRRQFPDSYLFDGGYFGEGQNSYGIQADTLYGLKGLEVISYDAALLSNKELAYGKDDLAKMLKSAKTDADRGWGRVIYPKLLCGNLDWNQIEDNRFKKNLDNFSGEGNYQIIEKYGSRLAVFGLFEADEKVQKNGIYSSDCSEAAAKIVKEIKKNDEVIDGIVCLYNGDDAKAIAKVAPSINVIIATSKGSIEKGQNTAVEDVDLTKEGNTYIVETLGKDSIGQIVFTKKDKGGLEASSAKAYKLDSTIENAQAIVEVEEAYTQAIDESYFKEFGLSATSVLANNSIKFGKLPKLGNSSLGDLIGDSYRYIGKKYGNGNEEIAATLFCADTLRGTLNKGTITPKDVYELFTNEKGFDGLAGRELVDVYFSGAELKILAEIDASISQDNQAVRLFGKGLVYEYNPNRFYRNRVSKVYIANGSKMEEVEDRNLYRVISDAKTLELIQEADKAPFGLMDVSYKDKKGNPLENIKRAVIERDDQDIKQWYAVSKYIAAKGISSKYYEAQNSKILNDDNSLKAKFSNPGKIFTVTLLATIIAIALVILIICVVIAIIRRALGIRNTAFIRQARKANKQKSIFSHRRNRYTRKMKYRKERRFGRRK